jgi:hypothetical protein
MIRGLNGVAPAHVGNFFKLQYPSSEFLLYIIILAYSDKRPLLAAVDRLAVKHVAHGSIDRHYACYIKLYELVRHFSSIYYAILITNEFIK